jgi:L-ascorbate metabolism protein UlaG (beta-lactamase superfamily)
VGLGSTGFRITIGSKTLLNLGDSVLLPEWEGTSADILMLPIGGLGQGTWTMDVDEALAAVELIAPRHVIPCHYSVPLLLKRKFARADDQRFKREVEKRGAECTILKRGESLVV